MSKIHSMCQNVDFKGNIIENITQKLSPQPQIATCRQFTVHALIESFEFLVFILKCEQHILSFQACVEVFKSPSLLVLS